MELVASISLWCKCKLGKIPSFTEVELHNRITPRLQFLLALQAGAGLVADSVPEAEFEETVNKAAALGRAIDLAEQAFVDGQ